MARPRPGAQEPTAINAEVIRRKARQVRHEDYFAMLEVRKGAPVQRIEQSYREMRKRFAPTHVPAPLADRHYAELEEICHTLDDAFAVLSHDKLREDYLRALLHGSPDF